MKTAIYAILLAAACIATASCTGERDKNLRAIDKAENAYTEGNYAQAQGIADSIMLGENSEGLTANDLCRLSLLFIRLGESSANEEANTAMAARALGAAFELDSDSTESFIENVAVDDRARVSIVRALTNARTEGDTIINETDSIIY